MNLTAAQGVAVREFRLASGFGRAGYALYASGGLVGAVETWRQRASFASFETQTQKYSGGVPAENEAPIRPLPFLCRSVGMEAHFTNRLDPAPRRRRLFSFYRLERLADWLAKAPVLLPLVYCALSDLKAQFFGDLLERCSVEIENRMEAIPT